MDYKKYEDALAIAELDCFEKLCEILGVTEGRDAFIAVNKGLPDSVVFDIGSPETSDVYGFPSTAFHWRGTLEIYNRSRAEIQRKVMRLVAAMPILTQQATGEKMREGSPVIGFRLAPTTTPITQIVTTEIKIGADRSVATFTATAAFDIIFVVD